MTKEKLSWSYQPWKGLSNLSQNSYWAERVCPGAEWGPRAPGKNGKGKMNGAGIAYFCLSHARVKVHIPKINPGLYKEIVGNYLLSGIFIGTKTPKRKVIKEKQLLSYLCL